jgi:hypothetical protein
VRSSIWVLIIYSAVFHIKADLANIYEWAEITMVPDYSGKTSPTEKFLFLQSRLTVNTPFFLHFRLKSQKPTVLLPRR